jgi:hypothetical protein
MPCILHSMEEERDAIRSRILKAQMKHRVNCVIYRHRQSILRWREAESDGKPEDRSWSAQAGRASYHDVYLRATPYVREVTTASRFMLDRLRSESWLPCVDELRGWSEVMSVFIDSLNTRKLHPANEVMASEIDVLCELAELWDKILSGVETYIDRGWVFEVGDRREIRERVHNAATRWLGYGPLLPEIEQAKVDHSTSGAVVCNNLLTRLAALARDEG